MRSISYIFMSKSCGHWNHTWLLVACLLVQSFPGVSVLRCSGSLNDVYFYQLNMLVANNYISKHKMLLVWMHISQKVKEEHLTWQFWQKTLVVKIGWIGKLPLLGSPNHCGIQTTLVRYILGVWWLIKDQLEYLSNNLMGTQSNYQFKYQYT